MKKTAFFFSNKKKRVKKTRFLCIFSTNDISYPHHPKNPILVFSSMKISFFPVFLSEMIILTGNIVANNSSNPCRDHVNKLMRFCFITDGRF